MPALVTHYLFGLDALALGSGPLAHVVSSPAERTAFLLACQGPDPFFFAFGPPRMATRHVLARRMHRESVARAFESLRSSILDAAPVGEGGVGIARAFACGMLAHYALDRTAHPFVYAFENRVCASDESLANAHHEVHARIESDLDGAMLALRGTSFGPGGIEPVDVLADDVGLRVLGAPDAGRTADGVAPVAGFMLARCARDVYGLRLGEGDWGASLADMRRVYRLIEPAGSAKSQVISRIERVVRPHSALRELAHRYDASPDCAAMNPSGGPWTDPFVGSCSDERFVDVFERGQAWYGRALEAFLGGGPCEAFVAGLDYRGCPSG